MAQQFIKYTTDGLKIAQTEEASAKCFLKLCKHTKAYMHTYTGEIIENIFLNQSNAKDWESNECHHNILASLAVLICRGADEDSEKCTQYMLMIIKKFIEPLNEKVQWIKAEQAKAVVNITEKQLDKKEYDRTVDHIDLIGEFVKGC